MSAKACENCGVLTGGRSADGVPLCSACTAALAPSVAVVDVEGREVRVIREHDGSLWVRLHDVLPPSEGRRQSGEIFSAVLAGGFLRELPEDVEDRVIIQVPYGVAAILGSANHPGAPAIAEALHMAGAACGEWAS